MARVVCFSEREVCRWESWVSRSLEAEAEACRFWARSFQGGGGGGGSSRMELIPVVRFRKALRRGVVWARDWVSVVRLGVLEVRAVVIRDEAAVVLVASLRVEKAEAVNLRVELEKAVVESSAWEMLWREVDGSRVRERDFRSEIWRMALLVMTFALRLEEMRESSLVSKSR